MLLLFLASSSQEAPAEATTATADQTAVTVDTEPQTVLTVDTEPSQ